jgi:hypothetical protein
MTALADRFDHRLVSLAHRAGLPERAALYLVKGRRLAFAPGAWRRHVEAGRRIRATSPWCGLIPEAKGYAAFGPDFTPELAPMVEQANAAFAAHGGIAAFAAGKKPFLTNVIEPDDLVRYPAILDFATAPKVVEAVTGYLGMLPRLHAMAVFVSPVNDTTKSSQLYHIDGDDFRQIKIFVNLEMVDDGAGPLTLLPADVSDRVRAGCHHRWGHARLTDEQVFRHCNPADQVALTGPAGSGAFIDTARCLHFGSRARERHRVVLMLNYNTVPNVKIDKGKFKLAGMPLMRFPEQTWRGDPWREPLLAPL